MKKLFILLVCLLGFESINAQCTSPTYTLNFSAAADTSCVIKNKSRGGVCCVGSSTMTASSNCISFLLYLNPGTEIITFDVTSPSPSGSAYYQLNCGTPVAIGAPLCVMGLPSPVTITYCKPGGDQPNYLISALATVKASEDITMHKTGCRDTMFVSNVVTSSIVWTSIFPGAAGSYNNYLSCTSGCNSTIVSPVGSPPPYVDFEVSGIPNPLCKLIDRDTVRVYFVPNPTGTITPLSPMICTAGTTTISLTANISGGAVPYKYDWSSDPGTNNLQSTMVSTAGTYTVIVGDKTKCPALTLVKTVTNVPPTAFSYSYSQYCKNMANPAPVYYNNGQPGIFSATPAGLSFVSTSTGVINLAASFPGTYVVTNTISASGVCAGSSSSASVTIYPFPVMTSVSSASVCSGNSLNIPLSSSMSSNFNWYANDNPNTTGESITTQTTSSITNTLMNATLSNEVVIYTVTPIATGSGNCQGNPQTVSVTVKPKDDAGFNYPTSTFCQTGTNPNATITGLPGGSFSSAPGLVFLNSVGKINLTASTIGSYTVTYTTSGICPNSSTFPVNITLAPSALFSYTASPYCQSAANPLPTYSVFASGGTFSSSAGLVFTNSFTGEINLAASTPGTYTVLNTIAPSGLCGTSSATAAVTITKLKEAGFSYTASPICQTSANPLPTFVVNGEAGTFSSPAGLSINSSTGLVNLTGSTPGTYVVTNTIAAVAGCPVVTATSNITVTNLPIATFNYSSTSYCSNSGNQLPVFTGGGTAGAFIGSSVYLDVNSSTGLITISNSVPGDYTIYNTIAASMGCPDVVASYSITITELPNAAIFYDGPYCSNATNPTPTLNINGTNGLYSFAPSGLVIDNGAGTVDLSSSTPGSYTVTNTIVAAYGCPAVSGTASLTITKLPVATFNYSATPYCINGSNPLPTYTGGAIAGTFSATPGTSVTSTNGLVSLSGSSAGTHTITNSIAAANGCPIVVASNTITINPITTANAAADATICASGTYTLAGSIGGAASTLSWTTSGSGSFSNPTAANSKYTPSASDISAGSVVLTIKTNDPAGPCSSATDAMTLIIRPTPTVSAGPSNTLTCSNTTLTLSGAGTGVYAWSGPSIISGANTATPAVNGPGTYSLVVTSAFGCPSNVSTVSISQNTVTPIVNSSTTSSLSCSTLSVNVSATSSVTPVSFNWSGDGITSSNTNSMISVSQGGTFNYTVTNTVNNCKTIGSQTVVQNTVTPLTSASTTRSITCINDTIDLNSSLTGMNYSWIAPSGCAIINGASLQNATGQGLGTYTINVTNPFNNCTYSTAISAIQNTTTPTGVSAGTDQNLICGVSSVTLTGTATPTNSIFNWIGGVCGVTNSYSTTACADGNYTMTAAHPNTGCMVSSTVSVVSTTNAPQATVNPVTNSITCNNFSVSAGVTLSNSDPVSYSWSGPGIEGSSYAAVITATTGGIYNVVITNTVTNCFAVFNTVVPTDTIPVTVSIAPASSVTCSSPSVSLNASPAGSQYTYAWSGQGVFSGGTTATPNVNLGGDANVTVTNTISGCTGTATVTVPSNTIIPVVLISVPSITTTCAQPTATINTSSTPATNIIYSWTAPSTGTLNTYTVSNPVVSGSGIFTVTITDTISGCISSLTQHTVEVYWDTIVPTATLSASSLSITCSTPTPSLNLTASIGTASYSWSPSSGIVSGTETSATPSFNLPGTYSVVVTNTISGCASLANQNGVTVELNNTVPVINMTGGVNDGTITCSTTSITVSPTITPNVNLTYSWTSGTGSGISGATNQSTATFIAAGSYTLVATDTITGCVSTQDASSLFTVYTNTVAPTIFIASPSVTTTCSDTTAMLNIVPTPSTNIIYSWSPPPTGSLNFYNVSNPVASGSGIFTITITDAVSGCTSSSLSQSTISVVKDTVAPSVTLSNASISITCSNPTPSLSISCPISTISYSWSPTTGIVAGTESTSNPYFNLGGTYSLVITNTVTGCSSAIDNNTVNVLKDDTIPVVNLACSVNNGTISCLTPSITISSNVSPNNNVTYQWNSNNGWGISSQSNQASATFTASGVYALAVTNSLTGCTSVIDNSSKFTVFADTVAPVPNFNYVTGCAKDSVKFIDQSTMSNGNIIDWNWSFGDGNNSLLQNPANAYVQSNTYTVSLQVKAANGCVNMANSVVNLTPPVVADFVPRGGEFLINQPISFVNQSSGSINYAWNFGDGNSDQSSDPIHAFNALGNYEVMLIASNSKGCMDTSYFAFNIKSSGYAIPGGFTPNGDGMNDGFSVLGGPFTTYELRVFNAWGNEIFLTNSPTDKWDGSYKNTPQPAGTYIYVFNGQLTEGEQLTLKGEVNIIR